MTDANVVKQIDAPMPSEAIPCHKRIALCCSSGGGFDDGLGNLNNIPFGIVDGILAKLELSQVLAELLFRLKINQLWERVDRSSLN